MANGVRKGPRRAKKGPQNPTGPFRAYFGLFWGGQAQIFSKSFWAKIGQIFFPKQILHYFDSQRVWDPQKPKIDPVDPQWTPFWLILWAFWANLGSKQTLFSQKQFVFAPNHFLSVPRWSGTLKNRKLPLYTPNGPQMTYIGFPHGLGPSKNPKLVLYTPPHLAPPVATHPARSRKELSPIQTLVYYLGGLM